MRGKMGTPTKAVSQRQFWPLLSPLFTMLQPQWPSFSSLKNATTFPGLGPAPSAWDAFLPLAAGVSSSQVQRKAFPICSLCSSFTMLVMTSNLFSGYFQERVYVCVCTRACAYMCGLSIRIQTLWGKRCIYLVQHLNLCLEHKDTTKK